MPGVAPGQGSSTWMPGCAFSSPWLAASTMPSLTPNFILRGASLALILAASDPEGKTPGIFLLAPDSGAQPGMRVK